MISSDTGSSVQYQFTETQDWFSHNIPHWKALLPLVSSPRPRVLEVGSWEGRSAVFLLQNLTAASTDRDPEIVCIDHFDLFRTPAGRERFRKINHNLLLTKKPFRVLAQFSVPALMELLEQEILKEDPKVPDIGAENEQSGFDWVYIDGSHEADDTFLDGELAWRLARKGAVVIFDDYLWDKEPEESTHHPKRGIDAFLELHRGEYTILTDPGHYQVALHKTSEMRIGFLVHPKESVSKDEGVPMRNLKDFGYGIHIALVIDSAYAMGAAVVILSTIEHTPGRITFYIVDCGTSPDDKQQLREILPPSRAQNVTIIFLPLLADSLGRELGPIWSKLDLAEILPVERVLYLDADILVRSSIEALWVTDLQGQSIAAAPDVGHPMGHDQNGDRKLYFNAGVLLLDVSRMRSQSAELKQVGRMMKDSKFRDQDALNVFYADQWTRLSLTWNAQGLGTYARYPSSDRDLLRLLDPTMDTPNPAVVHFTGPVHPSLEEVLSLYVQPPTAKPWGYLGAPGHPFQAQWWEVVERTAWKGKKAQGKKATEAADKALSEAIQKFGERVKDSLAWISSD